MSTPLQTGEPAVSDSNRCDVDLSGTAVRSPRSLSGVRFRIPQVLFDRIQADLRRPHKFAAERVGFLSVATGTGELGELIILGLEYLPIADDHYVEDYTVGVRIGGAAIRDAMERIRTGGHGLFHVHLHDHDGIPAFSSTDRREQPRLIEAFRRVGRRLPHGMLVLSNDRANAWVWLPDATDPVTPEQLALVGYPMTLISDPGTRVNEVSAYRGERFERQSFLGPGSQVAIESARVGVVGLGGGGSHVTQQLAHLGFRRLRGFDGDVADETNLNRLIGARSDDVEAGTPKTDIARRLVEGLVPGSDAVFCHGRWQDHPEVIRSCDVVIGCVDSFAERRELEVACRRYIIPYIDIGMDIHQVSDEPPRMAGQVLLSMPSRPCMFCLGFLTEERLAKEAAIYGAAGARPQVVWPNGVLASTAVGIAVDLVTGWTLQKDREVYLSYDGNTGEIKPHVRLRYIERISCGHFGISDVGDPAFRPIKVGSSVALHEPSDLKKKTHA